MEGKIIDGYMVRRFLGQGTFGQTWLVEKDSTKYALKIFKNEMIRSKNDIRRIDREILALKKVKHDNVIKYIDDGVFSAGYDKFRYLVMEYADGEPLRNVIESKTRLTINETQKIAFQILAGLKAIHETGLLHRDLKPDNIFLTTSNQVRVLDFGLVKLLDASSLTNTGDTMGTYAYMSPEQLKDSKNVDYRADLYSLGAILFHMVTGRVPLEIHNLVEAPYKILSEIPPFASTLNTAVPNTLDNIIATLLEKEVYRRKYTLDSLYNELRNLVDKTIGTKSSDLQLRFLPRLLHNERTVVENFTNNHGIDGIVFSANFLPKYQAVFDYVRDSGGFTMIDPVVYRLAYSKFTNTKSLINLPYVLSTLNKERAENFDTLEACKNRAKLVLDWQLKKNPSVLVAPFHFISDINDPWLEVDIKLYNECKKYLKDIGEDKPLYIGISTQIESLADDLSPVRLVNKYTRTQADGYMLMFDVKLDDFNRAHYFAFARLVSMLGELSKPIVLSRVNDFGLGLMSMGATALSSGIGYIESFRESILIEDSGKYSLNPKYYIPQLLTSYTKTALKDVFEPSIGKMLACTCPFCQGKTNINYLTKWETVKGHYLWQKRNQIRILGEMTPEDRLLWFEKRVASAKKLAKQLKKASKSKHISYNHFDLWIDALIQAKKQKETTAVRQTVGGSIS